MEVKVKRIFENLFVPLDFSNFCVNIHANIECNEEKCEYQKYSNLLKTFLALNNKCEQKKKEVFSHCELYKEICCCMKICFVTRNILFSV